MNNTGRVLRNHLKAHSVSDSKSVTPEPSLVKKKGRNSIPVSQNLLREALLKKRRKTFGEEDDSRGQFDCFKFRFVELSETPAKKSRGRPKRKAVIESDTDSAKNEEFIAKVVTTINKNVTSPSDESSIKEDSNIKQETQKNLNLETSKNTPNPINSPEKMVIDSECIKTNYKILKSEESTKVKKSTDSLKMEIKPKSILAKKTENLKNEDGLKAGSNPQQSTTKVLKVSFNKEDFLDPTNKIFKQMDAEKAKKTFLTKETDVKKFNDLKSTKSFTESFKFKPRPKKNLTNSVTHILDFPIIPLKRGTKLSEIINTKQKDNQKLLDISNINQEVTTFFLIYI